MKREVTGGAEEQNRALARVVFRHSGSPPLRGWEKRRNLGTVQRLCAAAIMAALSTANAIHILVAHANRRLRLSEDGLLE
jgi:hypothetical protein